MICKGCGVEISDSDKFCIHCGFKKEIDVQSDQNHSISTPQDQLISEQEVVNEVLIDQVTYSQMSSSQLSSSQVPFQGQSNQMPPNQAIPSQVDIYQYNRISSDQGPSVQGSSTMPINQMGTPLPTGTMMQAYQGTNVKNKKKTPLMIIVGGALALIVILGIIFVPRISKKDNDKESIKKFGGSNSIGTDKVAKGNNFNIDKIFDKEWSKASDDTDGVFPDDIFTEGDSDDTTDDIDYEDFDDNIDDDYIDIIDDTIEYNYMYSYIGFPDVISLESDNRFGSPVYYETDGIYEYEYTFNITFSEDDFYNALNNYCMLLQEQNGFYLELEYSEQEYDATGINTLYLSRDKTIISVTAEISDQYYAYISIYNINTDTSNNYYGDGEYTNYNTYILGREANYFDINQEITMYNGISFYVNSAYYTDRGDGTMNLDINLALGSYYDDCYAFEYDFLLAPMDAEGYLLSDISTVYHITDNYGELREWPLPMNTAAWEDYTFTFIIPSNTVQFSFYGVNIYADDLTSPFYAINMSLN